MPNLKLFESNRLEILADLLSDVLRRPLPCALEPEIIVVQSRGMDRWISTEIARRIGICANLRFPFPNAFVSDVFQKLFPGFREPSPFDPGIMTWKIMELLPACIAVPAFEAVRNYLDEPVRPIRLFQLCERIADLFDQYLLFRPEMILAWEQGEDGGWQAALWRELVKRKTGEHRATLRMALLEALDRMTGRMDILPARISVFGISALPQFHMDVLTAISRVSEVNLFLMNPCREYWGDIVSGWEMKRFMDREAPHDRSAEDLHLEKGNSLLASMGTLGRDFFDIVRQVDWEELQHFQDPGEKSLLACIQSDVLSLRERGRVQGTKKCITRDDTSVQIHVCHGPMREIEILRDALLDMFDKDPSLLPKDVLVMTPNIEAYAPYIQAVFDVPGDDPTRLPFSIADRGIRQESEMIEVFLSLLDLPGSRLTASEVVGLLEAQVVRERFGLSESDLEVVRRWISETGIRWGIDEETRRQLNLPAFPENTWKAGLERLLLGYALPAKEEAMFEGILAYDHVEGDAALVLGKLVHFCRVLFDLASTLDRSRTLKEWGGALAGLLNDFFSPDEKTENELLLLQGVLADMAEMEDVWGIGQDVDFEVVQWYLKRRLETQSLGFGFISGGITFCAMLPMRSIPFKVICLAGMDGNSYPRESHPLSFDLMAQRPRRGDRSRRDDDRYLFLEAILSARERLYISYVGQSIQDNSAIPPSVLVSELMDYIEQAFETPAENIFDHVVTKHRLQAFSPDYFQADGKLFSYSESNRRAAEYILKKQRHYPAPFISTGLPAPEEEWKKVNLLQLQSFFSNPSKFLLNKRLGIFLEERTAILEDRECFEMDRLDKYLLEKALVEKEFSGYSLKDFYPIAKALGKLPHGIVGACTYDNLCLGVERFVEKTKRYLSASPFVAWDMDVDISGFRVTGKVQSIYPQGFIQYRYARVRPQDRLNIWLYHLLLNIVQPDGFTGTSLLVGLDPRTKDPTWSAWEFGPVRESEHILSGLLGAYWAGLTRPLRFFPKTSWKYAEECAARGKSDEVALLSSLKVWLGDEFSPSGGEGDDPYYNLCFRGGDPLDVEFRQTAREVFGPLLAHQRDVVP
jgi:exodeoxyribonuclease V gamma subunit